MNPNIFDKIKNKILIFYKAIYFLLNEFEFDNLNQKCIFASNEIFKWIQKYINP